MAKKKRIHVLDESAIRDCTGCGGCEIVCAPNVITMDYDSDGFYRPSIDLDGCTLCGVCPDVCYKFNVFESNDPFKNSEVIAVTNNFIDDTNLVTTAGVATRLAKYFF